MRNDTTSGRLDMTGGRRDTTGGRCDTTGGRRDTTGGRCDTIAGRRDTTGGRCDTTGGRRQAGGDRRACTTVQRVAVRTLTLAGRGGLPEMGLHVGCSPLDPPDSDRVRSLGRSYSSIDMDRRRAALRTWCMGTADTASAARQMFVLFNVAC